MYSIGLHEPSQLTQHHNSKASFQIGDLVRLKSFDELVHEFGYINGSHCYLNVGDGRFNKKDDEEYCGLEFKITRIEEYYGVRSSPRVFGNHRLLNKVITEEMIKPVYCDFKVGDLVRVKSYDDLAKEFGCISIPYPKSVLYGISYIPCWIGFGEQNAPFCGKQFKITELNLETMDRTVPDGVMLVRGLEEVDERYNRDYPITTQMIEHIDKQPALPGWIFHSRRHKAV